MNHIYTYFEPVPEIDIDAETRLILLWQDNWRAHGFEPVVLTEWHARKHPYFAEYDVAVSALPSVNPKGYDRACYIRWLALAQVRGCLLSDYDVFCYADARQLVDLETRASKLESKGESSLVFLEDLSPSLVLVSPERTLAMCELFASYKPDALDVERDSRGVEGVPHTSDQNIIQRVSKKLADSEVRPAVCLFDHTREEWKTAAFVHYNNGGTTRAGRRPRHTHIPKLRELKVQTP